MAGLNMTFAADVPIELFPDGVPGPGEDPTSPLPVHDYDFTGVGDYSDLDYTELRATLGLNHKFSAGTQLFAAVSLYDLDDSQPFLQDGTGSVMLLTSGLTWSF